MPNDTQGQEVSVAATQASEAATQSQVANAAEAESRPAAGAEVSAAANEGDATTQQSQVEGDGSDRDEQGRYKSKIQKRFDELTHARHAAEREAAHWRAIAEGRKASPAPQPYEFSSDADYEAAARRHEAQEAAKDALTEQAREMADRYGQDAETALNATYDERARQVATRIPDFVEVVSKADIPITPEMQNALKQSAYGPEIVYQLAKNPEEAMRIASMPPALMYMTIGQMQGAAAANAAPSKAAAPAARTTGAPPPAKTNDLGAAPPNTDPSTMSMEEFKAWARANGSRHV